MTRNLSFFLARSLDRGGAERQLVTLAKGLSKNKHPMAVAVFYSGGAFDSELANHNVRLISLDKKGRWDTVPFLIRLVSLLHKEKPTVLHTYLTVPNLFAVLLKPLLPATRIVWGIRASNMDLSRYDWLSRLTYFWECKLSRFADLIIANSNAGKYHAVRNGFPASKIVVIPNGIDTERFQFDFDGRNRVRAEWGVTDNEMLIGLVARLDPMKGHSTFLEAASLINREQRNVRFVCVGNGTMGYTEELKQQAVDLGLADKLIWAEARDDVACVYSALDIACSASSFGEGFSNSIAEAMACGIPCVVSDVGDSAWIVKDCGVIVPASSQEALADGLRSLINLPIPQRVALGRAARVRVVEEFSLEALVSRTEQVLELTQ